MPSSAVMKAKNVSDVFESWDEKDSVEDEIHNILMVS